MKRLFLPTLTLSTLWSGCDVMPTIQGLPDWSPTSASSTPNESAKCADQLRGLNTSQATRMGGAKPSVDLLYWCTKAAEQGDAKSQFALAGLYERGIGVPANRQEAVRWYKASANKGYAEAQFKVGQIYGRGEGVPQDKSEASRWYIKAAEQGHPEAQYYMGYRYEHGKGVTQNYPEAVRWYTKAAEQGNVSALNGLGSLYLAGHGVPQSQIDAYKWFNLAAASGKPEFIAERDKLGAKLTPAQLADGQKLASDWARLHPVGKGGSH
jgi:TPR repeat protein